MTQDNPLAHFYRTPKLYVKLPSLYKFYNDGEVDVPETGELPVYSMTAKDEMSMKNPDALLNGEAVAQLLLSCVPAVKKPRQLISNDVDTLLVAIQGASYGDDIEVNSTCPECSKPVSGVASIEAAIENMTYVDQVYSLDTPSGLTIEIKPFSYESSIKAGIANFKSTRTLKSIMEIDDELEQIRIFNESFIQIAALNFELLVDGVSKVSGTSPDGEKFVVTDKAKIRQFLENCDGSIGNMIDEKIQSISNIGIQKLVRLECTECGHQHEADIGFDPVNFFMASSLEPNLKK